MTENIYFDKLQVYSYNRTAIPNIATDGLLLHWDVSVPQSYLSQIPISINDLSGNYNNGAFSGTPTYNSGFGGYVYNNGQYVSNETIGSNFYNKAPSFTISAWLRIKSGGFFNSIMGFKANDTNGIFAYLDIDNVANKSYVYVGRNYSVTYGDEVYNSWTQGTFNAYAQFDAWAYVTIWGDGTNIGMYVNTTSYGSTAAGYNLGTSGNFVVGRTTFTGNMDIGAVHVYNRGLNLTEITSNYNNTKARFGL